MSPSFGINVMSFLNRSFAKSEKSGKSRVFRLVKGFLFLILSLTV